MKERILIGLIAVVLGVTLTAGAFYLWQATKVIPKPIITTTQPSDSLPTPENAEIPLTIESPLDESVVDKRIIQVKGMARQAHAIIISSGTQDLVVRPAGDGSFSTNVTLSEGVNDIEVISFTSNGEELARTKRAVTFTTETF